MLKESFIVQKRLELRDWETKDIMEAIHKVKDALEVVNELQLNEAARDITQFLDLLTDEFVARCKDDSIWDYFFKEGKEPSHEG